MANQSEVLRLLMQTAPEYCSGDWLATQLGISRTAIWKLIQNLQQQGYSIESRHAKGYRYVANNQLSAPVIEAGLKTAPPFELIVLPTVDSTNAYLRRLVTQRTLSKPVVVIADTQTAGYGRSGRQFYSPRQTGLYLSIALPVDPNQPLDAGLLTTGTAVAVAKALRRLFAVDIQLKWVNDVLVNQRKVVGILSEGVTNLETRHVSTVIVGIGINLSTTAFPPELTHKAGALLTSPSTITRNRVASELLETFFAGYPMYQTGAFLPEYRRLSMVIGQQVALKSGQQTFTGKVLDIDAHGALVVALANGEQRHFSSGEIIKVNLLTGDYHG
ncbi:biotin--[acetyl-CoA-carboxylase] ligase [Lactiplantibacillus modestisalitolerans]|uniref:Bifunctional ligase/repressor BirA n=1 Tax=Lactiplantibacillus modestisalitolerans TaxID=1457219 RepID=A0ABV5WRV9_9LACO|nr:biotin--[acetyl-CoA-carboxylase] ligase [Lactiplantibacillus modestisalitolerans]